MKKYKVEISLLVLIWLLVINTGNLGTLDTDLRLQMTHAWWTGGSEIQVSPQVKPIIRGDIRFGVLGVDGKRYISYEQGQSLLMLPGDWLGTQLHALFPNISLKDWRDLVVSFLIFIPLNILSVIVCFNLLREFGFSEKVSQFSAIIWFLGTTFLQYAQHHQQNNQVLLFVLISYSTAAAYLSSKKNSMMFISGLAAGAAMLMRITSLYHVLTVILFILSSLFYKNREKYRQALPIILKSLGIWIWGFIPLTLLGRWFDYQRYGSFLLFGKKVEQMQLTNDPMWYGMPQLDPNYPFINAPYTGFIGSLFSPAKSIFIYDPLLLPCLILAVLFWKKINVYIRIYVIVSILNLLFHLLTYTRFDWWTGDVAWAARYQVTSVQLLLIPLIGILVQYVLSSRGIKRRLLQGAIAIAFITQFASVAMHPQMEISQKRLGVAGTRLDFRLGQRIVNLGCILDPPIGLCQKATPKQKEYLNREYNRIIFLPFNWLEQGKNTPIFKKLGKISLVLWFGLLFLAIFQTVQVLAPLY